MEEKVNKDANFCEFNTANPHLGPALITDFMVTMKHNDNLD